MLSEPSKILIVDDDPISLAVVAQHLQIANYQCVIANHGQEAWELLQKTPKDFVMVIADRIMPYLHGIEVLAKMQQHSDLKEIPLIMLTGEADREEISAAFKAGVFDFLYKPVEKELLLAVVKRALKK